MRRIYDVSVPIRDGGLVYPGNPDITISLQQAISRGAGANVSSITFGSHTGTHVDAARHFFDDGPGVDAIPLQTLMGAAVVLAFGDDVHAVGRAELDAQAGLRDAVLDGATRVLLKTRNSSYLTQDPAFHQDYTYLSPDGAEYLVSLGVELVGVDYLSVEQFHSGHHRTHRILLGQSVVIVEGLDLARIEPGRYDFHCLPLRIPGCDAAPARAILIAGDDA